MMKNYTLIFLIFLNVILGHGNSVFDSTQDPTRYVSSFGLRDSTLYIATWGRGVLFSSDRGRSWTEMNKGLSKKYLYCLYCSSNYLMVGTEGGGIFLWSEKKSQWIQINEGLRGRVIFALTEMQGVLLASSWSGGLFRSENGGRLWEKVTKGLKDSVIYSLCASKNRLYAGGSKNGVYQSKDYGLTWKLIGLQQKTVTALIFVDNSLWCGTWKNGIYTFFEQDERWEQNSINFRGYVSAFTFSHMSKKLFCASKMEGVYRLDDAGDEWISIGLNRQSVFSLFAFDDVVFAGTWGEGIFSSTSKDSKWIASGEKKVSPTVNKKTKMVASSIRPSLNRGLGDDTPEKLKKIPTQSKRLIPGRIVSLKTEFPSRYTLILNKKMSGEILIQLYSYYGHIIYRQIEKLQDTNIKKFTLRYGDDSHGIYVLTVQTSKEIKILFYVAGAH